MNHKKSIKRRHILTGLVAGAWLAGPEASAQMSQRARQIRDREACEQDRPDCKADIRLQLDAERRRMRIGLSIFAVGVFIGGLLLFRRYRRIKKDVDSKARQLQERLSEGARDSSNNQAL